MLDKPFNKNFARPPLRWHGFFITLEDSFSDYSKFLLVMMEFYSLINAKKL